MPLANYDYDTAAAELARRQRIFDAMQAGTLAPIATPTAGGMVAPISPMESLSKVYQAYLANRGNQRLSDDRAALAQRYKDDLSTGVKSFMDTMQGTPAQTIPNTNPDGVGPAQMTPATPGDPKAAILAAIGSNHPVLQQLGSQYLPTLLKADPFQRYLAQVQTSLDAANKAAAQPGDGSAGTGAVAATTGPQTIFDVIAPNLDRNVAMGLLASDPSGQKLMAAEAEAAKPVVGRGDGLYSVKGGRAALMPGYGEGVTALEGAKAGVQDAHTLVETKDESGRTITRTKAQQLGLATGAATPEQLASGGLDLSRLTSTQQLALARSDPEAFVNGVQHFMANGGQSQPSPVIAPAPAGIVSGPSIAGEKYQGDKGATEAAQEATLFQGIQSNRDKLQNTNQMIHILPQVSTGPAADAVTFTKGLMTQLGMQGVDPAKNQTYDKYAYQNAVDGLSKIYGGKVAVQELNQAMKNNPGASMSQIANAALLLVNRARLERELQKPDAYIQMTRDPNFSKIQFPYHFDKQYPLPPLHEIIDGGMKEVFPQAPAGAGAGSEAPMSLDAYLQSKGVR